MNNKKPCPQTDEKMNELFTVILTGTGWCKLEGPVNTNGELIYECPTSIILSDNREYFLIEYMREGIEVAYYECGIDRKFVIIYGGNEGSKLPVTRNFTCLKGGKA